MREKKVCEWIYEHCVYDFLMEMNHSLMYYNLCIREVLPEHLQGDIKRKDCNGHCACCIQHLMHEKVKNT